MKTLICICLVCLPLKNLHINSSFGYRIHPVFEKYIFHAGVDLKAHEDTVYAIMDGLVMSTGYDDGLGIHICLKHGDIKSIYGHLSKILVGQMDTVSAGEPIGITGATGRVTGQHLHFAIRYKKQFINPIKFLYELLIKNENEQKLQSTSDSTCR